MTLEAGQQVLGIYFADRSVVELDDTQMDIIAENDKYIVMFKPGRSIYKANVGSEYEPARIFFAEILKKIPVESITERQSLIDLRMLLEAPIRRR